MAMVEGQGAIGSPPAGRPESEGSGVWGYQADLARLARSLCRNHPDAEDVTQSSLLKAAQHLDGFRGEASVRTWLHRIVTNECRMLHRRSPQRSVEQILETGGEPEGTPIGLPRVTGPEESVLQAELQAVVLAALAELPSDYRTILLLADGKDAGLTVEDIAVRLGASAPAVRAKLHRARALLRERLRPYWTG